MKHLEILIVGRLAADDQNLEVFHAGHGTPRPRPAQQTKKRPGPFGPGRLWTEVA
ncbi:hypothetical protein D3C78_1847360 [compost metagenome]